MGISPFLVVRGRMSVVSVCTAVAAADDAVAAVVVLVTTFAVGVGDLHPYWPQLSRFPLMQEAMPF